MLLKLVSIPQAVGTIAITAQLEADMQALLKVSIPQAVGTIAMQLLSIITAKVLTVSIPQAVGTIAITNSSLVK